MHRLGIPAADAAAVAARLRAMAVVDPDLVLMTHFARSDEFGERATPAQIACFESACQGIAGTSSLANSAAALGWPDSHAAWVRPGGDRKRAASGTGGSVLVAFGWRPLYKK